MLFLLSPAKTLDESPSPPGASVATAPVFGKDADTLAGALARLPVDQLRTLLGVSAPLASTNHARYAGWSTAAEKAAIFAFHGHAYKALDWPSLKPEQLAYVQSHLRVLCGLYGVLRPTDAIKPYRLEMGAKLKGTSLTASDLYAFWGDRVAAALRADVAAQSASCVVNVASGEYWQVIKPHVQHLGCPIVTCVFPGPAVHSKAARGSIVRWAAITGAATPADLRGFTGAKGEWSYVPGESSDNTLVFHRGAPAGPAKAPGKAAAKRGAKEEVDDEEEGPAPTKAKRR
jgi:cytoplasmic iron level regulating protein YaaA (DUF328/UPF0246 family)